MEQIEHQRVTAHPAQRRADRPAQRREASAAHEVVEEVPRPEQKQPGQQREIVGGEKALRHEAQIGRGVAGVEGLRQGQTPARQVPEAVHRRVGPPEQQGADGHAHGGRDAAQQRVQRGGEEHGRAQQSQHPEPHHVLGQEEQGDGCDQRPCPEDDGSPPERMMPQRQAEARKQDEDPADALLPHKARASGVPLLGHAEEEHHVPHPVVEHHADEVESPQLVQKTIAGGSLQFHRVLLPSCKTGEIITQKDLPAKTGRPQWFNAYFSSRGSRQLSRMATKAAGTMPLSPQMSWTNWGVLARILAFAPMP